MQERSLWTVLWELLLVAATVDDEVEVEVGVEEVAGEQVFAV